MILFANWFQEANSIGYGEGNQFSEPLLGSDVNRQTPNRPARQLPALPHAYPFLNPQSGVAEVDRTDLARLWAFDLQLPL